MTFQTEQPSINIKETLPEEIQRLHQISTSLLQKNQGEGDPIAFPSNLNKQLTTAFAYGEAPKVTRVPTENLYNAVFIIETENGKKVVLKTYAGDSQETRFINELGTLMYFPKQYPDLISTPKVYFSGSKADEPPYLLMEYLEGEPLKIQDDENLEHLTPDMELILEYFVKMSKASSASAYIFFADNARDKFAPYLKKNLENIKLYLNFAKENSTLKATLFEELEKNLKDLESLNEEGISSLNTFQKGDDHVDNFKKTKDGKLIGFDAEWGGIFPKHLNFAEFIWHEKTRVPMSIRQELVDRYVKEAGLSPQEITQLNRMLEASWLKWLAVTTKMALPGNISHHPLKKLVPIENEAVWQKIVEELNQRVQYGPKGIQAKITT